MTERNESFKVLVLVLGIGILVVVLLTRGCDQEERAHDQEPIPGLMR